MLSKELADALNKQIKIEAESDFIYLAMASWCEKEGFCGAAAFLYAHGDEERTHFLKMVQFVNSSGQHALIPGFQTPKADFADIKEIFNEALAHERFVTQSINELAALAWEKKDMQTFNFLQWFVAEQQEEEALFQGIVDQIKLIGLEGRGPFFIDKELKSLAAAEVAAPAEEA